MNTEYWASCRTLASYGLAMAFIIGLTTLMGCDERYSYDECWDKVFPRDSNQAAGMAVVETARTEAATEAKIKLMNAVIETGCNVAAWICLGIAILGIWPFKSRLMIGAGLMGVVIFTIATFWMAARAEYPKVIATVGLVIMLSILAVFIVVVIRNRRALVQVVRGGEMFKKDAKAPGTSINDNVLEAFRNLQAYNQTKTTEKIVDKIRNKNV